MFQTMGEIAVNQNSTIILPVPIDLIRPFMDARDGTPERRARTVQLEEEEAVGEASPQPSPDEVRPERENVPKAILAEALALCENRAFSYQPAARKKPKVEG
jgi:hypothetical protein